MSAPGDKRVAAAANMANPQDQPARTRPRGHEREGQGEDEDEGEGEGEEDEVAVMPDPNRNADVGSTYTEGMHDHQIAQVLHTYDQGGDCEALGVPHHTDRTLPMPMAGHVYLQCLRAMSTCADPSMRELTLVCDNEQAALATKAKVLKAALPVTVTVGRNSSRVLVGGSIRSILKLFGVSTSNSWQVGSMLCTEINKKKKLCPSTVSKNMNKKKSGGEQGNCAAPVAVLAPISPLAGLSFGAESSIKPLPAALPPTALWVYMNPDVPNDPRIKLPNPPILLERRLLPRYEQSTPDDYSEPARKTPLQSEDEDEFDINIFFGGDETPLQSEDEGELYDPSSTTPQTGFGQGASTSRDSGLASGAIGAAAGPVPFDISMETQAQMDCQSGCSPTQR